METGCLRLSGTEVLYGFLNDGENQWMQFWYSITPVKPEQIAEQIGTIERAELELFNALGIAPESIAARKFFSSDLITHYESIVAYKERQPTDFFLSLTDQPPAVGAKLALLGMCLGNITARLREQAYEPWHFRSGQRSENLDICSKYRCRLSRNR